LKVDGFYFILYILAYIIFGTYSRRKPIIKHSKVSKTQRKTYLIRILPEPLAFFYKSTNLMEFKLSSTFLHRIAIGKFMQHVTTGGYVVANRSQNITHTTSVP